MKTVTVRLPDDLHDRIKAVAELDRRSLNSEILWLIEQGRDHGQPNSAALLASAQRGLSRASLDLSKLAGELTARIDGYRHWAGDATWEASPGDRPDEIVMVRLTQDGPTEHRTIRVHLEER